ncbi:hypothetical protein K1X84_07035 [bacterium]|nr:hypothetical protein [bacterium]
MNKRKIFAIAGILTVMAISLMYISLGVAREDSKSRLKARIKKPDIVDALYVGYNNWSYVMRNQGSYFYDSPDLDDNNNNAGGEFPRGSGRTIVYAAGLYVAAPKNGVNKVCSEVEFSAEYQPGHILNSNVPFASLQAEDPALPTNKVYVIDKDNQGEGEDAARLADWTAWPGLRDVSNTPALIADAQTWAVFNDLDLDLSQEAIATSPDPGLGLEVTLESYAINEGSLADVVFIKMIIANKTNVNYDSSYIGLWMDADVNNSGNDIVGIDTVAGLGFVYDSENEPFPAATGFDFFQGPVVDTAAVSVELRQKFGANKTVLTYNPAVNRYEVTNLPGNQIWLGATSFNTYANGTDPHANFERYNLLAGLTKAGAPKTGTGENYKYAFPGNPLTQQGTANVASALDRNDQRILHGCGPFRIEANSAQTIWAGVIGGEGANRLAAFAVMKTVDSYAQTIFNAGLVFPRAPAVPAMSVAAGDGKVDISWNNAAEYSVDNFGQLAGLSGPAFSANYRSNDFQGYRVYKSLTGLSGSYDMIAEYDLIDGRVSQSNAFIDDNGYLRIEEVVFGTDNGLKYSYTDHDVVNGRRYYYAVTSYDAQPYIGSTGSPVVGPGGAAIPGPLGLPITLETAQSANVTSVVPSPVRTSVAEAQVDSFVHVAGGSDGLIEYEIVDYGAVTNTDITIEFYKIPDSTLSGKDLVGYGASTTAYRVIKNGIQVKFSNKLDNPSTFYDANGDGIFNGTDEVLDDSYFATTIAVKDNDLSDEQFYIIDGIMVKVYAPPAFFKSVEYQPGPQYTAANMDTAWFTGHWDGQFGDQEYEDLGIGDADHGFTPYVVNYGGPPNNAGGAEFNRNLRIVFSRNSAEWSYSYSTSGGSGNMVNYVRVPFRVFEVDPSDGNATPRQLNIVTRDRNTAGANSRGFGLYTGGFTNDPLDDGLGPQTRGYFFIDTTTYDLGAKTGHYGALAGGEKLNGVGLFAGHVYAVWTPAPRVISSLASTAMDGVEWNEFCRTTIVGTSYDATTQNTVYTQLPDEGTIEMIVNHPYTSVDRYTLYTSGMNAAPKATVKKSMKDIKVVPNPYYARATTYQSNLFNKTIKFMNLPDVATIKVFTVAGDLVTIINHNSTSNNDRRNTNPLNLAGTVSAGYTSTEQWNLKNEGGKFVASGMYIALIEAPGVGKTTVKFAVIQEATTINGPDVR